MERLAFQEAVDFTEHSQSHWVSHEFRAKAGTEKDVQERYLRGKKWVNKKEMERLAICTCSWAAQLDKWCFRKGYPPARTLKLWLHYFFFEKNFISTKKDLLLSFLKNVYFFYLFVYFDCAETLAVCVTAHGLCFSCSEQGLFLADHRFLVMVESLFTEHRLRNCSTRAFLPQGIWDLPRPGIELMSLALAGGFLTVAPSQKFPTLS